MWRGNSAIRRDRIAKRIFTPFPENNCGNLKGRLPSVGVKPDKPGRYNGFQPDEYVYSPKPGRQNTKYETTTELSMIASSEDQLYINAHCSRGLDFLANTEDCDKRGNLRVTIDDVIAQLKAHGLPQTSEARIKLWVCEGALEKDGQPSFARQFSAAIAKADYTICRIFGYSLSVWSEYKSTDDDPVMRKRTVKTPRARLDEMVPRIEAGIKELTGVSEITLKGIPELRKKLNQSTHEWKAADLTWLAALQLKSLDRNQAKELVANTPTYMYDIFKNGHGGVGNRARESRVEFKNGEIVP